ncbi:MAG: hypothetical protein K2J80_06605 [Oscillospiraceae bacterium]|nr:hypothetical protein [Oscillospiraceae bacterium]
MPTIKYKDKTYTGGTSVDIATTISNTSDNNTLPTSKAVYDYCENFKDKNKQGSEYLSSKGWYRFACVGENTGIYNNIYNISRYFNKTAPESHTIVHNKAFLKNDFKLIGSASITQLITKIRVVQPKYPYEGGISETSLCYLDLYYNSNDRNRCFVNMLELMNFDGKTSILNLSSAEIPNGYEAIEYELQVNTEMTAVENKINADNTVFDVTKS